MILFTFLEHKYLKIYTFYQSTTVFLGIIKTPSIFQKKLKVILIATELKQLNYTKSF